MPRISKNPAVRKAELTGIAARLFHEKGFAATSVDDIVNEAKVAKGTFYYYFKSKDEVLQAVVDYLSAQSMEVVAPILQRTDLDAVEKLRQFLAALRGHYQKNSEIIEDMHGLGDDAFHLQSVLGSARMMSPAVADIFRQGIMEGVFQTEYPDTLSEILLLSSNLLVDDELFPAEEAVMLMRIQAIQELAEKMLNVPPNTLYFISKWEVTP